MLHIHPRIIWQHSAEKSQISETPDSRKEKPSSLDNPNYKKLLQNNALIYETKKIQQLESIGARLEENKNGFLVIRASEEKNIDLKKMLYDWFPTSKYKITAYTGGNLVSEVMYTVFKIDPGTTKQQPIFSYNQTKILNDKKVQIETNHANGAILYQPYEQMKSHGDIEFELNQLAFMDLYTIKTEDTEKGKRLILTRKPNPRNKIEMDDIFFTEMDEEELTAQDMLMITECFNRLAEKFPGYIDKVEIRGGQFSSTSTAGYNPEKGIVNVAVGKDYLKHPLSFEENAAHEYGHVVMNQLSEQDLMAINDIFNQMEKLETETNSNITSWFLSSNYVKRPPEINLSYTVTPNSSELFAMAFSIHHLNRDAFNKKFYNKATPEEKALVDKLFKYMPKSVK